MLEEITIRSLGVIDRARLDLGPGFTVVTGETGAGKTMVVSALGLLLGARADSGAVRAGSDRARVEGRFSVDPDSPVAAMADEIDAELDDRSLIIARSVSPEGRSRATAGGAAVPVSVLGELAAELVGVHGQSDQQRLLQSARQRSCLDTFAGAAALGLLRTYWQHHARLLGVQSELADITGASRERAREADLLRYGLDEIAAVDPRPGEDEELRAEEQRLGHLDGLRRAAESARAALNGDEAALESTDALALVAAARKSLEAEAGHDPALAALAEQLASASYLLADVASDISSYGSALVTDPARLGWVQERRAALAVLTRKYGDSIDDVLAWSRHATERLLDLDDNGSRMAALRDERETLVAQRRQIGEQLTSARAAAAAELAGRVGGELTALAMPDASFSVVVRPRTEAGPDGFDDVAFELVAHPGAPPRPLHKGASGGELSRIMLAIEVCLAGSSPVPTMVFDEVDAGIGGKAAVEVGRRLARLSCAVQVIVVTHLPQVAAFADRHYSVVKSSNGSITTAGVRALDQEGRRSELSRMLAGLEDSSAALAHADELVDLAHAERASR